MQMSMNFDEARRLKDEGMKRAEATANDVCEKWSERAMDFIEEYARSHPGPFKCEDIRTAAIWVRVPLVNPRSWGGLMPKAAKMGLIRRVGTGTVCNPRAHMAQAGVWESMIYRGTE